MKVEFAPINIPLERRIQTVAVLQWIFSFLLLACWLGLGLCYRYIASALEHRQNKHASASEKLYRCAWNFITYKKNLFKILGVAFSQVLLVVSGVALLGLLEATCSEVCCGLFMILILSKLWFLAVLYLLWLYLDWETPCTGGRRSQWVRSWTVWKYFREYFPINLIKTSDLSPDHNYLLGFHPHGVLVAGAFGNFCTGPSFKNLFPGLTPYLHIMPIWFGCPFFREYIMSAGMVSASKESVSYVLNNQKGGHASVIVIGGAEESLNAHPGSLTLNILKRKGFIKMALKHGAHLVPVFSFGENELFKQVANPKGSWLRNVQEKMQKIMGFALPLFHARGVFQYSFGLIPYRQPIHTVVGSPIPVKRNLNPTTEEIEQLHALYLQKLRKLFEEHKRNYGIPEHKSLIFE